ncbi:MULTISPECIES: MarR family winged helix-turn-helix transcriptional regulator [unclassified Microbacterium]|uniref:MarR family winged helix-turn-helix transcriptional regulator n=1 Tax=unclassified Microbacterium TaxID=2609290 RepID=UPI000AE69D74|nr:MULTISPECIES: MarR family transcriptional regulator [unclassified Microbacterium]
MAVNDSDAARIADALARVRLPRRPGGPVGGPFGGEGPHGHGGGHGFGPHGHAHGHGPGPFGPGPFGRGAARIRLLETLASAEAPLSVGEIGERLGVDQPRASRLVQAVVHAGEARREADPADARRTLIALTDAGRATVAQSTGARVEAVERALAGFAPEERAQLAALLGRLADAWPR